MLKHAPFLANCRHDGALGAESVAAGSVPQEARPPAGKVVSLLGIEGGGAKRSVVGSYRKGRRAQVRLSVYVCGVNGEDIAIAQVLDAGEEGVFMVADPEVLEEGQCVEVLLPLPRSQGQLRAVARVVWRGYKGAVGGLGMRLAFADEYDAGRWRVAVEGWAKHHQLAQLALLRRVQRQQRKRVVRCG